MSRVYLGRGIVLPTATPSAGLVRERVWWVSRLNVLSLTCSSSLTGSHWSPAVTLSRNKDTQVQHFQLSTNGSTIYRTGHFRSEPSRDVHFSNATLFTEQKSRKTGFASRRRVFKMNFFAHCWCVCLVSHTHKRSTSLRIWVTHFG